MNVIKLSLLFVMVGWILIYLFANFENDNWVAGYYLWDKTKDCLLIMGLASVVPVLKRTVFTVFLFAFLRLILEILDICRIWDKNHHSTIVFLYIVLLIIFFYNLYLEIKK